MNNKNLLNIGLIGFGYWGPNLARNFVENQKCNLKYICDINSEVLKKAKKKFPSVETINDFILQPSLIAFAQALLLSLRIFLLLFSNQVKNALSLINEYFKISA